MRRYLPNRFSRPGGAGRLGGRRDPVHWIRTPMGQRYWGGAVRGDAGDGSIVLLVDEPAEGSLVLRNRDTGEDRVLGRSGTASLRPGDGLGEAVWDVYWSSGSDEPRRVQAAIVDPRARAVLREGGRTMALMAYRTGGGGSSIRALERAKHFEVASLSVNDGQLAIVGALHSSDPQGTVAIGVRLEGSGRGAGVSALVPATVSASGSEALEEGQVRVEVTLEQIRLSEYAGRSGFRVALQGPGGELIDLSALAPDPQRRRRLRRAIETWVADPEERSGHVEEKPSASRVIRAGVADDGGVWVDVASPKPAR